jgi:pimeloyl-ACP methyl ester carboxylesterase
VTSGDVAIGYQVVGEGPVDVVVCPPLVSGIERAWRWPWFEQVYPRLARRSRLIVFDKRGMGASDRDAEPALPETAMEDMRAVMDAAGVERAVLVGISEGTPLALLFAAIHPERTAGLVLFGAWARWWSDADYPWGRRRETGERSLAAIREVFFGPRDQAAEVIGLIANLSLKERRRFVENVRLSADWPTAEKVLLITRDADVRHVLPDVKAPVLLVHGTDDQMVPLPAARYLSGELASSTLLEVPGEAHLPTGKSLGRALDAVDRFLAELAARES